jgi:hypothetical protein
VPECKTDNNANDNPDHKGNSKLDKLLSFHGYLFIGNQDKYVVPGKGPVRSPEVGVSCEVPSKTGICKIIV